MFNVFQKCSINTPDKVCFKSRNQELKKNLRESYGEFSIPKFSGKHYSLKSTIMNKVIKDSWKKSQDAEKGRIKVRPAVSSVSDATYHDSVKDKAKFIEVMCRYNTANKDVKASNYQVHAKKFDHGTAEDVLL